MPRSRVRGGRRVHVRAQLPLLELPRLDRVIGERAHVAYGPLEDEPTLKPTAHIFVGSKAPWYEITDDLPQHDEY
jgi:hypothetical protein